jgi:hypothetical protein
MLVPGSMPSPVGSASLLLRQQNVEVDAATVVKSAQQEESQ